MKASAGRGTPRNVLGRAPQDRVLNIEAQRAPSLLQTGNRTAAEAICRNIVSQRPAHFHAVHLLGLIAFQEGRSDAAQWLRVATKLNPSSAIAHSNLAAALLSARLPHESLASAQEALRLQPQCAEAWTNRGNALRALGRLDEAIASDDRALTIAPRLYDAHIGRASAQLDAQRFPEALNSFEQALALNPESGHLLADIGMTLLKLQRPEEALRVIERGLARSPMLADLHNFRGSALRTLRRLPEALASYQRASEINPESAGILSNTANVLLEMGQFEQALEACDRALALEPDLITALNIRCYALQRLNRMSEAAVSCRRLLELAPNLDYAAGNYLHTQAWMCQWSDRGTLLPRVLERVSAGERAVLPWAVLALSEAPAAQLQCAQTYVNHVAPRAQSLAEGVRYRHERLRIAYISPDFGNHPVTQLLVGVLEKHDRRRFEVHALSLDEHHRGLPEHDRVVRAVGNFHDVSHMSDRDIASRIRELEIDVAIDLAGHTRAGRIGIFAHHPAPVQAAYLGFMGTTGAEYIDYLTADEVALPRTIEATFCEQIVRLPATFMPHDDSQTVAPGVLRRDEAGLAQGAFVFCAFNNPYKISHDVFAAWMGLLREVPDSVLWLRAGNGAMVENLNRAAAQSGVEPKRLVFAPAITSMAEHLARYRLADLYLDTYPYGAHATAHDALWAGLPVLTCTGQTLASRVAASLLASLGLNELIVSSISAYVRRARQLALERRELAELRQRLARARLVQSTFSTLAHCSRLEAAYLRMAERAIRGEPPESFDVA